MDPASDAVPTNGSVHLSCPSPNATGTFWMRGPPAAGLVPLLGGDPRLVTTGADLWVTSFHAAEHTGLYYCLVAVGNGESLRSCPATLSHASKPYSSLSLSLCLFLPTSSMISSTTVRRTLYLSISTVCMPLVHVLH